jgi:polyhydroxybutyrate depolymerase
MSVLSHAAGTALPCRALLLASLCTFGACASGEGKVSEDAPSTESPDLPPMPVGGEPGTFLLVFEHNATEREAIVHVPESYDPEAPAAMLLNFHGYGGRAQDHMEWTDMHDLAAADGFILVYPQGTILEGSPHWNAALPGGDNKSDADDLGYVRELIGRIDGDYPLDSERVYATGYSNGGMMAAALACYASDLVASIGIVSGVQLDTSSICAPSHPTGVISLHGIRDGVVSYDGGGETPSVDEVMDFWVAHNQTDSSPTTDSDSASDIDHFVWANGTNGVSIEHYRYNQGEHVWFEETFNGSNASDLVWEFLRRHDINGAR